MDARQFNYKKRDSILASIKDQDAMSHNFQKSSVRQKKNHLDQLELENRKMAVKLFSSKSSYQANDLKKQFQ